MKRKILSILLISLMIVGCTTKKKVTKYNILEGEWIATPEYQIINDEEELYEEREDYILVLEKNGKYNLKIKNKFGLMGYYASSNNDVVFINNKNNIFAKCKLINDKELDCNEKAKYAIKYIKKQKS